MRRALALLAPACAFAAGCYSMVPVANSAPPLGSTVSLAITDAGRVALGGLMGPEIERVDGRLVDRQDTAYTLAVSAVHLLRGGMQVWNGERVQIRTEHVRDVQERRFSKSKSAILAGTTVAVLAAIIRQSLVGSGQEPDSPSPGDTAQSIRIPWP